MPAGCNDAYHDGTSSIFLAYQYTVKISVGQNVDYDTFKNMVAVAHLRPLQAANTAKNGMGSNMTILFRPLVLY